MVDSNGSFQEHPDPANSNDTTKQKFRRAFQYAKNGNLTRKEIFNTQTDEVMDRWQYTYSNHAAKEIAVNGTNHLRMTYDSVGNLTDKEDLTNNLHKELTYNSYNRITQVKDVTNNVVVGTYHYDDQGFRVHKKGYYDKGDVPKNVEIIYPSMFYGIEYVPEDSTADSINNIYLNGVRIAALDQDSAVAYFITDQVDSVNLVLDDAGDVLTTTQYLPYGETFVHRGDTDFAPKYNSQELDKESGLYYFNARYYDGELARFTSADTVIPDETDTQSWNRFAYSFNNPILYKDPTGHNPLGPLGALSEYLAGTPLGEGSDLKYDKSGNVKNENKGSTEAKENADTAVAAAKAVVTGSKSGVAKAAIKSGGKAGKSFLKQISGAASTIKKKAQELVAGIKKKLFGGKKPQKVSKPEKEVISSQTSN